MAVKSKAFFSKPFAFSYLCIITHTLRSIYYPMHKHIHSHFPFPWDLYIKMTTQTAQIAQLKMPFDRMMTQGDSKITSAGKVKAN